jgi:hypothetical protein
MKKLKARKIKQGKTISEPRLESFVYSVIHGHSLGGCRGKLTINEELVAFQPEGDSKDGFSVGLAEIGNIEAGNSLKMKIRDRTYSFKASEAKNKESNRYQLRAIEEQLTKLKAKAS